MNADFVIETFFSEFRLFPCINSKLPHDGRFNKLSLVGMQLPEKYKENFDVSSEDPWSGFSRGYLPTKLAILTRNSPFIFL